MYILMNNNIEEIKTAYIQTVNFRVVMNGGNNEKKIIVPAIVSIFF